MAPHYEVVFLFDVDNTLLDNDRVTADLRRYLEQRFGPEVRDRYFTIFEELRAELGYADYLGTLQRYRLEARCDVPIRLIEIIADGNCGHRVELCETHAVVEWTDTDCAPGMHFYYAHVVFEGTTDVLEFNQSPAYGNEAWTSPIKLLREA